MITFESHLNFGQVSQQAKTAMTMAIQMMMNDIQSISLPLTPMSKNGGHLRNAVSRQMVTPELGVIKWHAPYAEYQERGFTTGPVMHYTTPGTQAHFVRDSLERVIPKFPEYLRAGGLV